jgi:hypothetical protein
MLLLITYCFWRIEEAEITGVAPLKIDNPVCIPIMDSLQGLTKRKLKLWPGFMIGNPVCTWKSFAEARKHAMKTLHQQRDIYLPIFR